jgi:hypothetical protein
MKFTETFDETKLKVIIANLRQILKENNINLNKDKYIEKYGNDDPIKGLETRLRNYLNKSKKGSITVKYHQNDGKGRNFADKALSLQSLKRQVRQTICHEFYDDLDMINAHPVILLHMCKENKIKTPFLKEYVNNRDQILKDTGLSRDEAKKLYLMLMNSDDLKINRTNDHIKGFKKEMQKIHKKFYQINKDEADKHIKKRQASGKNDNSKASYVNTLMCDMENKILMKIIEFYHKPECVLCFDGVMFPKKHVKKSSIKKCEKFIKSEIGITMKLKIKEMDEVLDISKYNVPTLEDLQDKTVYQDCKQFPVSSFDTFDKTFNRNHVSKGKSIDDKSYFTNKNYNIVLKSDTGTGKTTAFSQYIRDTGKKFISIGSRIAMCDAQTSSFDKFNLDIVQYNQFYGDFTDDMNIIIMLDSIRRIEKLNVSDKVLYLDELSFLIDHMLTSDTMNEKRMFVFRRFIKLCKEAKQIIATDADINDMCHVFLDKIGINYKYHKNDYLNCKDIIASEVETYDIMIHKIKKCKRFLVCCDSKTVAQGLSKKLNDPSVIVFDGDYKKPINIEKYDKVIISPKVITGVDSTKKRNVFCIYKEHTIDPQHMVQQINRCRNIEKLYYHFPNKKVKKAQYKNIDDVYNEIDDIDKVYMFKEFASEFEYMLFRKLYGMLIYNKDCAQTNKFLHFKNLLKDRGFKDDDKYYANPNEKMTTRKELIKEKIENIDIDNYKWTLDKKGNMCKPKIQNDMIDILNIPDDKLNEHINIIFDEYERRKHFDYCTFFFKDNLEKQLNNMAEFNSRKLTGNKGKMFTLKKICETFDIDIKKGQQLKVSCDVDNDTRNKMAKLYKTSFRFQGKKLNFDENQNVIKFIANSLNNLFNKKTVTKTRKGRTQTIIYTLDKEVYEYHEQLYKYRHDRNDEDTNDNELISSLRSSLF